MKFNKKEVFFSVFSVLFSLSFFCVVAEVATRIYLGEEPENEGTLYKYKDVKLGFKGNDGFDSQFFTDHDAVAQGVKVHINNVGLRDYKDRQITKPSATARVAIFGDSFTFGRGNEDMETGPAQLEKMLNDEKNSSTYVEVLNFGVSGFNTIQQYIYLTRFGMQFEPDVVLIQWLYNDFNKRGYRMSDLDKIASSGAIERIRKQRTSGANVDFDLVRTTKLWLRKYSDFYEFILAPRLRSLYGRLFDAEVGDVYFTNFKTRGAQLSLKSLNAAFDFCKERGIEFGVVIYPGLNTLNTSFHQDNIYSKLERFCEQNRIPVLNLYSAAFKCLDSSELVISKRDSHPNAKAQKIAAQAIAPWVTELLHKKYTDGK